MRLFDEAALRKLEQLTLVADSVRVGAMKGDRRSRKRGTAIEFADYRDYVQGDDLRRLDWNAFARLDRPYIRLTEEEEDLAVHILVDTSGSMNWPPAAESQPDVLNKLRYSLQLAGALGNIGLLSGDLVHVSLADSRGQETWGPFRGRQNGWPLIRFLEAHHAVLTDAGRATSRTALDASLRHYALRARRPGLFFLISDLLAPGDYRGGLTALLSRGYEIALLHVLSPDEVFPDLSGDLALIDIETGERAEISLDALALAEYAGRVQTWREGIAAFCAGRGIHYAPVETDEPWERLILRRLRHQGVVR